MMGISQKIRIEAVRDRLRDVAEFDDKSWEVFAKATHKTRTDWLRRQADLLDEALKLDTN